MPRPEYRDPNKKVIYAEVSEEIYEMFSDIQYKLDMDKKGALAHLVRTFYEQEKIKPRPSRKAK